MAGEGSLSKLRILVVDDNANMRLVVRQLLGAFHAGNVAGAEDGAEALRMLEKDTFDLIITDHLMEPIDGLDLIRSVRAKESERDPYIPIILLTGAADAALVARARDAGVTEVLAKPVSAAALYRRLEAVVDHPRSFVRAEAFFGPDRRRRPDEGYDGENRREEDQGRGAA
jgi:CheY-like chemotaxis protein